MENFGFSRVEIKFLEQNGFECKEEELSTRHLLKEDDISVMVPDTEMYFICKDGNKMIDLHKSGNNMYAADIINGEEYTAVLEVISDETIQKLFDASGINRKVVSSKMLTAPGLVPEMNESMHMVH